MPVIYEDKDESEEEESEDAMETDQESDNEDPFDGVSDAGEGDDMSD